MTDRTSRRLRGVAAGVALMGPVGGHIAIALGQPHGIAVALAAVGAVATGGVVWLSLVAWRWVGVLISLLLLVALGVGALRSAVVGLLWEAGVAHAILYTALLVVFGGTLRPGRTALVTWVAGRLNPHFHAGQVAYTRGVTWAWVVFFAGQLAGSAVLLCVAPVWWARLVTGLHAPLVVLMVVAEAGVRRWRWRHEHSTGLVETVRGVRRLMG